MYINTSINRGNRRRKIVILYINVKAVGFKVKRKEY